LASASKLAKEGIFVVPIYASYTMRMQSNPYRSSIQEK
jgi:hypothetical protein